MRTPMRRARYRSVFLIVLACLLLGLAELRLFHLQVLRARDPADSAIWRRFSLEEQGRRGDILDARGGVLATTVREVDVRVWTSGVAATRAHDRPRELAEKLAALVGVEPAKTLATLAKPGQWTLLASGIRDPRAIAELRDLARSPPFRALSLETRYVRDYPRGSFVAPLLGWVSWQKSERAKDDPLFEPDGVTRGVAGVESLCERELAPSKGRRSFDRDGRQREMADPSLPETTARDGRAIELTIEPLAQSLVEESIDAAMAEFKPTWAQILVLDPLSGDVLAVAQRPTPAAPRPIVTGPHDATDAELHHFLPVERVYPPGSSFKPFMLGLALEKGVVTPGETIDCEHGAATLRQGRSARTIHDSHRHDALTATGVLVESSNIGMAKIVLRLVPADARKGDPAFQPILDHIAGLGFGKQAYGFAGEARAIVPARRATDRLYALASLAFGQGISITTLQMAAACAAVANGGTWRPARFVRAIEDESGELAPVPEERETRTVFSPATAATVKSMMRQVVEQGATRRWKAPGWSMAGKTGTAEDERRAKTPVTSYWCFAPVEQPRFLVLAVLDEPKLGRFAADNAAKVAAPLLGRLLERFEVPRDEGSARLSALPLSRTGDGVVVSRAVGEGR
jgi:cell division protein FtsI (penicillin-binding protein 3)